MMLLLCSLLAAWAGPVHTVLPGDTLLDLAGGDADQAEALRELNGLEGEPVVGTLIELLPSQLAGAQQTAFLLSAVGEVTLAIGQQAPAPLAVHQSVSPGATVCTSEGGSAALRLATLCTSDGDRTDDIVLSESTCVKVESVYADISQRSTVVRVLSGSVRVQESDADGAVSVLTDAGVTAGQGGFRVTVEDESSRTEALSAPVAVAAQGVAVDVGAGQGSRTVVGEAPGPAVDLLPPGLPTRPGEGEELVRPRFEWEPVESALGYRLEIAADPSFQEVLQSEDVSDIPWSPPVFMLPWPSSGSLYWRVSSFDRLGFVGLPSKAMAMRLPEGVGR